MSKREAIKSERAGVLDSISTRTKLIGLSLLVLEGALGLSLYQIPEAQRIYAFSGFLGVLTASIFGCVWLEHGVKNSGTLSSGAQEDVNPKLPPAMEGHAVYIDDRSLTGDEVATKTYRTAMNLKFAGCFDDAVAFYQEAVKLTSSLRDHIYWKSRYNVGSCLLYADKLGDAEPSFRHLIDDLQLIDLRKDYILPEILHGCYLQLHCIADRRGEFELGRSFLIESLKAKKDDALSYVNLAIVSAKLKRMDEARKWLTILLEHPKQTEALNSTTKEDKTILELLRRQLKSNSNHDKTNETES